MGRAERQREYKHKEAMKGVKYIALPVIVLMVIFAIWVIMHEAPK